MEFDIPSLIMIKIDMIPNITLMHEDRNSVSDEKGTKIKMDLADKIGINATIVRSGFIFFEENEQLITIKYRVSIMVDI